MEKLAPVKPFSMKRAIILCISFLILHQLDAQFISGVSFPDTTKSITSDTSLLNVRYANTIKVSDLKAHLSVLASDEYEGRETGEKGNEMAAEYISDFFSEQGISKPASGDTYFQDVAFTFTRWEDIELNVNGNSFKHLWDFIAFPTSNVSMDNQIIDEVVFLGYGIETDSYSDYKGKSVEGKTIMVYSGDPRDQEGNSRITGTNQNSDWTDERKTILAKSKGAKLVLIIKSDIKRFLEDNRRLLLGGSMQLGDMTKVDRKNANHLFISTTVAREIMNKQLEKAVKSRDRITKKGKSCQVKLKSSVEMDMDKKETVLLSKNVMAYVEGSEKPEELIVVSAHYDHIGKKGKDIFNGADDNGTGTSTVLELAEAFHLASKQGDRPK